MHIAPVVFCTCKTMQNPERAGQCHTCPHKFNSPADCAGQDNLSILPTGGVLLSYTRRERTEMGLKPLHPCSKPGCSILTREKYCEKHRAEMSAQVPRESAAKRGYNFKWRSESKKYLSEHPWCAQCAKKNIRMAAVLVDHKTPHKGDQRLFWNKANWQGLCWSCHSKKTAKEDGGFGNLRKKP